MDEYLYVVPASPERVFDLSSGRRLSFFPRIVPASELDAFCASLTRWLEWEVASMVRSVPAVGDGSSSNWTRFVDIPLTGYTKANVQERYEDWDVFSQDLSDLLASGYRVGVSWNKTNFSFIVSVTCRDAESENQGCTFSSFAGDWLTALRVALFKHFVVARGVWSLSPGVSPADAIG